MSSLGVAQAEQARTEQSGIRERATAAAAQAEAQRKAQAVVEAASLVTETRSGAEVSREVVDRAVVAMQRIESFSSQIGNIVGIIESLAFQTNLLALNAGIEAARAGDAGRGFAVVAQEVRGLVQRSSEAAKEIKGLIFSSSEAVSGGVGLVGRTGEGFVGIINQLSAIDALVRQVSASAGEQAAGISAVNDATTQMDQALQQTAAMVHEAAASADALKGEVGKLNAQVGRFEIIRRGSQTALLTRELPQGQASVSRHSTAGVSPGRPRKAAVAGKSANWEEL